MWHEADLSCDGGRDVDPHQAVTVDVRELVERRLTRIEQRLAFWERFGRPSGGRADALAGMEADLERLVEQGLALAEGGELGPYLRASALCGRFFQVNGGGRLVS